MCIHKVSFESLNLVCKCPFTIQTTINHLSFTFFSWTIYLSLINTSSLSLWHTANVYNHFGLIRKFLHCLYYLVWN